MKNRSALATLSFSGIALSLFFAGIYELTGHDPRAALANAANGLFSFSRSSESRRAGNSGVRHPQRTVGMSTVHCGVSKCGSAQGHVDRRLFTVVTVGLVTTRLA